MRPDSGELNGADQPQVPDMEKFKTGAQLSPKSQENRSLINEVTTSKSILSTYHTDPIDFDAQLQEIDIALGAINGKENHVASSLIDNPLVLAKIDATVTPLMTAHTQTSQELTHHVAANRNLRTWKRVARDRSMETETS